MRATAFWISILVATGCGEEAGGKRVETDSGLFIGSGSLVRSGETTLTQPGGFPVRDVRLDGATSPDPESTGVQMCVIGSGEVVVAWSDDRTGTPAVWAIASADGGRTWPDPPVQVNDGDGQASSPSLACGAAYAILAFEDARDSDVTKSNIYLARTDDGGASWSANTRVGGQDIGVFELDEPTVAVYGNDVHVAWSTDENGAPDIHVASSGDRGSSFGSPVRLDGDGAGTAWSRHPVVGTGGPDEVVVAWEDRRSGFTDIYVAHSGDAGASYGSPERLDTADGNSFHPRVAADGADVYVLWHDDQDGAALEVYSAYSSDAGASFGNAVRVSEGTAGELDSVLPNVAIAGGTLHATWFQGAAGGYQVMYKQLRAGAEVGPQVRVDHAAAGTRALAPEIALDGDNVAILWRDDRSATGEDFDDLFYAHSTDGGTSWSGSDLRVDSLDPPGTTWRDQLHVVLDGTGFSAAWADGRGGNSDVYFVHLELGDEANPDAGGAR